ncbi:MAG TPA: hypothetical protein VER35_03480, partial [Candidatus Limnocylindrales bacterium]|nr:hypothetical protein [Candidatus Limnocylindrales bacterium]
GTTDNCHPKVPEPPKWIFCHTSNHWQQKSSMKEFVERVLIPYRQETIERLNLPDDQMALR